MARVFRLITLIVLFFVLVLPALPLIVSAVTEESIYYPAAANVLEGSYGGGGLLDLRSVNGEYYSVVSGSVHWTATAYHPITYSLLGGTLHISGFPSDTASDDNKYLVSIAAKSLIPKQYYASAYNLLGGTSLVSGGISNTTSDDGSYMIVRSYGTQTALSTYYTSAIRLLGSTGTVGDTAELRNDASWSSTAKSGSSIYFDGDDYLAVPSSSTFRSPRITFAAWIRTAGKTGQQHIIDCRDAYGGWNLRLDGSSYPLDLIWIIKDSNGVEHGEYIPGVIHNNTWYYVAGTYDGAYKKIYLNGQQIGSWYLGSLDTTQTYCEVHIGAFAGGSGYGFKGWIDEVVIYSEALDSSALQSNMNGNIVYSNLKAYWTFDENSGGKAYSWHLKNRINDDDSQYMLFSSYSTIRATSENTGTIMGSVTWTNGMHSGGLYLSGLSSMIEVPNHASLNPQQITVALWFKPMGKTGEQHLVDKRGSIGGFDLRIDGSTYPLDIIWILRNGTDEVGRALFGRIYNNTWTFIAATYDGQYMRIYNNTGLIGEWNIGYVDITGSTSPLHIGSFAYGNGYNFKGVVDNVAIYSRALSWTELASLRDNNPPSSGLIALWRLDEMQGSYAHSECEAYVSEVEFSGSSNTYVWEKLTFRVDSAWVPTSVNVTIQAYNYTDGKYPTSGIGYLSYVGGEAEEKSLIIQQNPMQFRSESGEWKIKITGWKLREPFTFKLDMLKCETSYYTKFAAEVEFTGEGDSYYWDYLNATFNLAWDAGEVSIQLYLWNYSASAYQLLASAVSDETPNVDGTFAILISEYENATDFRDTMGGWKAKIKCTKETLVQFNMKIDLLEFTPTGRWWIAEQEFRGISNTAPFSSLTWTVQLTSNASNVDVTLQLYNFEIDDYPAEGDGYIHAVSGAAHEDETFSRTITADPEAFRGPDGSWAIKVKTARSGASLHWLLIDLVEFKPTHMETRLQVEFVFNNLDEKRSPYMLNTTLICNVDSAPANATLSIYDYVSGSYSTAACKSLILRNPSVNDALTLITTLEGFRYVNLYRRELKVMVSLTRASNSTFTFNADYLAVKLYSEDIRADVVYGYRQYVRSLYVPGWGYRCNPTYNEAGGDYYNFWFDDHGKILLMMNFLQDYEAGRWAVDFLMNARLGEYPFGRRVNASTIHIDGGIGGWYLVNNKILGVGNYSATENTKIYERVMSLAHVVFPDAPNWIAGIYLFDADINGYRYILGPPSSYSLQIIDRRPEKVTVMMKVPIEPTLKVYGIINATLLPHKDYVLIEARIRNEGSSAVNVTRFGIGLGNLADYMPYIPYYSWVRLTNGTIYYTEVEHNTSRNYYIWNRWEQRFSGRYGNIRPDVWVFSGYMTPEFAKALIVKIANYSAIEELNYVHDLFGKTLRIVHLIDETLQPGASSRRFVMYVTGLDKFQKDRVKDVAQIMRNVVDGLPGYIDVDISMPASWGISVYALAEYAQATGDQAVMEYAKKLWNYYYEDVKERIFSVYFRSLYPHALAGLILDPKNSTYLDWARNVSDAIMNLWQNMNSSSPAYGSLVNKNYKQALEEHGWAYALLTAMHKATGESIYRERANLIKNSIKYSNEWSNLKVYLLDYDGKPYVEAAGNPLHLFRATEMMYALAISGVPYNDPLMLTAVSMIWRFTRETPRGLSISLDPPPESNTETQPMSAAAFGVWKALMQRAARGAYIQYSNSPIQSLRWVEGDSWQLEITVNNAPGFHTSIKVYTGMLGKPREVRANGSLLLEGDAWTFNHETGILEIKVVHRSSVQVSIIWEKPATPSPQPQFHFKAYPVDLGRVTAGSTVKLTITVEYSSLSITVNHVEFGSEWLSLETLLPKTFMRRLGSIIDNATIEAQLTIPSNATAGKYTIPFTIHATSPEGETAQAGANITFTISGSETGGIIGEISNLIKRISEAAAEAARRLLGNPIALIIFIICVILLSYYALRRRV